MISSVDAVDEIAYVSGLFSGSAVDLLASGSSLTSSSSGSGKDAFVAALDVGSSGSGPVATWVVQIGGSSGYPSVTVSGDYVYVAGSLSAASNISTCSLTAARGGYLAKLERATGACAWAKDVPASRHVVSDGTHVWTVQTSTGKLTFDDDHVLDNIGIEKDVFMAKYQASDGAGLWATVIGGTGDEEGDAAAITPTTLPYAACAAVVLCVQCGRARARAARPHRLSVHRDVQYHGKNFKQSILTRLTVLYSKYSTALQADKK